MTERNSRQREGLVFNIQRWSIHDGPGVRTVVFLKGCPMRCVWCCNPESHKTYNELVFFKDKCIDCGRCISCCPNGAIEVMEGVRRIDRKICTDICYNERLHVFPCTKQCYGKALSSAAELKTVDDVMKEVMKDELMYKKSSVGGLTLSGGEAVMQHEFSLALFKSAKEKNISTAMETCGLGAWNMYEQLMEYIDYLFFDIKIWDSEKHKKYVGTDNKDILENAKKASYWMSGRGKDFIVRIPVIPTISEIDDFEMILKYIKTECSPDVSVEIMPYHRLGRGKYADLGMEYGLMDLEPFAKDELAKYTELLHSYNFKPL